jgi:alkylhydroperoxidase/carboxymuconolactone decarboxylase family protein YurZ
MSKPPKYFEDMKSKYPEVFSSYSALGQAARNAGPLDDKTIALIKLALSLGAALEGASHGNARKALAAGCSGDELRHVAMLAVTTMGFPSMMRASAWVEDVVGAK